MPHVAVLRIFEPAGDLVRACCGAKSMPAARFNQPHAEANHGPTESAKSHVRWGRLRLGCHFGAVRGSWSCSEHRCPRVIEEDLTGGGCCALDDSAGPSWEGLRSDRIDEGAHDGISSPSVRGKALNWICTGRDPGSFRPRNSVTTASITSCTRSLISRS